MLALVIACITFGTASSLQAQSQVYPPDGYAPLLFDATNAKYVFRLNGIPWICRGDTFCKPVKIEGVADKDAAGAAIESLGFAGARYLLSYKQANLEKGRPVTLSCIDERCTRLDAMLGVASPLGTYQIKDGDRVVTRTALLRQLEAKAGRTQILWCTESDCSELPLTRDSEIYLSYMGNGRSDGHAVAWLRDKAGVVLSCSQPEEGVSDQIICDRTKIALSDFPANPTPTLAPPPVQSGSDADRLALAAAIDKSIAAGDFANADRLLADGVRRYAGNAAWPQLQQKLAKARSDHDAQLRVAEVRRLIVEARRFAQVGDFQHAETMLQDADKQVPGFAETAQARVEIAALRTERDQRYRERYQYTAAIDQAFTSDQLWEAERLLADYARRFNQDDEYRARAARLQQLRSASSYQARINEAQGHIATARQAMDRSDFVEAERQLAVADRAAPGFPEIGQARADLSRRRIIAEKQQDDLRLILALVDSALQRKQYDEVDRAIEDGRRRYGSYQGWADLQTRNASARRGDDRQANELRDRNTRVLDLVAAARRSTTQGDFAAADKALNDAHAISADTPEIAIARAELERAKSDRARQDAEIRALAASVDATMARNQYADAERLIAEGTKRYPSYAGWADLSRKLADARRTATPPQPAPTPPSATPPAQTVPANPELNRLVEAARAALRRQDFRTAEKDVAEAEKIDAKAASVMAVRAELKAAEDRGRDRPAPGQRN